MPPHRTAILDEAFDPATLAKNRLRFFAFVVECAETATRYAKQTNRSAKIVADAKAIYEVCVSAYFDIARYKHFHLRDPHAQKSDAVKRSAYFTKWILRLRPVVVIDEERPEDPPVTVDPLAVINEDLALQWSLMCIGQEYGRAQDIFLRPQFHRRLMYHLRMREISTDGLLIAYELIHRSAADGRDNCFLEYGVA